MMAAIPQAKKVDLIKTVKGTITTYADGTNNVPFSEAITQGEITNSETLYATSGLLLSTPTTFAANKNYRILSIKQGITKIRVYMWIEGQDIDCENNASGTDITYNIELSIRENPVVNP